MSPTSRKRSHDGTILDPPPTHSDFSVYVGASAQTPPSDPPSLGSTVDRSRQPSPATSATSSSLTELSRDPSQTSKGDAVPAKKRKLTFAEKEVERALKQQEAEAKGRRKGEEKARKDEEKRVKDDEKRKKEEEKEAARRQRDISKAEKQKIKDAEKHARDSEKRKKEEEQAKKQRSQMLLGAFFNKPALPSTPPANTPDGMSSGTSSRRSSIACIEDIAEGLTPSHTPPTSDYERLFPPFFIQTNTAVARFNRFLTTMDGLENTRSQIDLSILQSCGDEAVKGIQSFSNVRSLLGLHLWERKRKPMTVTSVRAIVGGIQRTSIIPIDLTGEQTPIPPETLLDDIPVKIRSFQEEVRPSYQGTFTRQVSPKTAVKLSRNPFVRALPDTNYDYDSEAEWEPPEEGDDDVDAVDSESESEEEEEDMEDFIDDEHDVGRKRVIKGELIPESSGLCWQTQSGKLQAKEGTLNFGELSMDVIAEGHGFPVNPYSMEYWAKPRNSVPASTQLQVSPNSSSLMQPPRLPLQPSNQTNAVIGPRPHLAQTQNVISSGSENLSQLAKPATCSTQSTKPSKSAKPLKLISSDLLAEFKQAVEGSNLSKAGLIEVLKKQFPKVPKDVIRDTLSAVAIRQGVKEVDKRWMIGQPP